MKQTKLSGSGAAHALGQTSLSPMLEGDASIPIKNFEFSPLICDVIPISGQALGGFLRVLQFAPPPSGILKIQISFQILQ